MEKLDYQNFDAGIIIKGFPIEYFSTGVKSSSEILIDELKPRLVEKIQFE